MILLVELVSPGTMTQSLVDPTEVFSFGLRKRAVQLIMVHNHPGGSLKPSDADTDITDRMYQVGLIVDLPVIDHLIITERKYYSFKNSGLLDEISRSQKYVVRYKKEEERLKNLGQREGEKIGIEKGVKKGFKKGEKIGIEKGIEVGREEGLKEGELKKAVEMAKMLKKSGVDTGLIALSSGLSKEQIEKL